jgi:hypothetical protein
MLFSNAEKRTLKMMPHTYPLGRAWETATSKLPPVRVAACHYFVSKMSILFFVRSDDLLGAAITMAYWLAWIKCLFCLEPPLADPGQD